MMLAEFGVRAIYQMTDSANLKFGFVLLSG